MKKHRVITLAVIGTLLTVGFGRTAVKPTTEKLALPAIWKDAGPQKRLAVIRAAEMDALRLLVERIYGINLDAETTVHDLVLADDEVSTAVRHCIKGVVSTEDPEYLKDGTIQIVRAVKLRQVLETVTKTVKKKQVFGKLIPVSTIEKVTKENKDTVIDVMGNGALEDSAGLRKIRAKRAAELDAYRKLAERIMGVQVYSGTKVKDLMLKSDTIQARVAQVVKGAKPVAIKHLNDGSCEVSMQLKIADIFEIIKKYEGKKKEILRIEREYATKTFTETGRGAPRPVDGAAGITSEMDEADGTFQETRIIIKRLVGQGIVLE